MAHTFLRNDGQFQQVNGGDIGISTTTTTGFLTYITNTATFNTTITSTAFVDGPSIAQGSSGVWLVCADITFFSTGAPDVQCKLWDGATSIAGTVFAISNDWYNNITLMGILANPAGNLRVSAAKTVGLGGEANFRFSFNATGDSDSCVITAIRIG